jgi:uncharacterized ion transporter superfamily protein YfcC
VSTIDEQAAAGTLGASAPATTARKAKRSLHPVALFSFLLVTAVALTWIIPSGQYDRTAQGHVQHDSFRDIPKSYDVDALWHPGGKSTAQQARPASVFDIVRQIPYGFARGSSIIFLIMFIGGTFSVLRTTGAMDRAIDWMLSRTRNNVYLVTPMIMVVLSTGSTLMGLTSEYLVIIPLVMTVGDKLKLPHFYATALVFTAAKIGYMSAVANPLPLVIAQPIVGVPVFSGLAYRFAIWIVLLSAGIAYLLYTIRRSGYVAPAYEPNDVPFPRRHALTLLTLVAGIAVIAYGASELHWGNPQLSAFYVVLAAAVGFVGGLDATKTIEGFIEGMRGMVLAAVLIGLSATLFVILTDGLIIDTIINRLSRLVQGNSPALVAQLLMMIQMLLDILIPSTTAQAAVTMPIVGPLALLSGVSGQVSVLCFLLGSGTMAFLTPTSAYLPAYLATGKVGFAEWLRYALPLAIILAILSSIAIAVAGLIGY